MNTGVVSKAIRDARKLSPHKALQITAAATALRSDEEFILSTVMEMRQDSLLAITTATA